MRGPARLAADEVVARVAEKQAPTPTQVALAWLLARYDRMLLVPGTSSFAHLEENMAAIDLELRDSGLIAPTHRWQACVVLRFSLDRRGVASRAPLGVVTCGDGVGVGEGSV
jgi:diketogulonate reductase-like aldo/keto reductase